VATDATPMFYQPRDVAKILKCSEWWVKEQARRRRIPFCWIGGSYRFTPEHLTDIARIFEHAAIGAALHPDPSRVNDQRSRRRTKKRPTRAVAEPAQLTARIPPRSRLNLSQENEAA
jgi:hypothetical protein